MKDDVSALTQLGSAGTNYTTESPSSKMLETFTNQYPDRDYLIVHKFEEFSSCCPKTGQPDFAKIIIRYVADKLAVESKSLKLYFFAFRNEGSFMETTCNRILEDLVAVLDPRHIHVEMIFRARGGIRTSVVAEHQKQN
jgi:7-cyano-7-deazaguanine reductase